ncbi:cation-translocating P-type ATPase [Ilumatobacter sp.]|uniref:cation-translocating P-type ATPase n=1 Tax=Ilumatobacter sp. TaxID=1967498 RepID=UPI003AF414B9
MSLADSGEGSPAAAFDRAWARTDGEVAAAVGADVSLGLTTAEAVARRRRFGANELEAAETVPLWRRAARQFTDPLVVLLLVAIVISLVAWVTEGSDGAPLEAIVIAVIVVANAVIGTWQEDRAIKAVAALRRLAGTQSTVVRDGRSQSIMSVELVPGDLLVLAQGDAVGADCRLIECAGLAVAEAALTGESTPVTKRPDVVSGEAPVADRTNMAYRGTAVAAGRGVGVVVATGMNSEIGRIARLIDDADQDDTPLQRQIAWLGRMLGIIVVVLSAVVVATIMATSDVSTFGDFVDAALVGVSLAVAAVPEGLPAILTIVLAMGVQRMAADHAIVKRLSSVETLGSASVICTDKTGTLTRNEMTIVAVVVPTGRAEVTGVGHRPAGELVVHDGAPDAAGAADVDTEARRVVTAGSIANDASFDVLEDDDWEVGGDPTEVAFLVAEEKLGLRPARRDRFRRVDEIPFDSDRKLMTTINEGDPDGAFGGLVGDHVAFTKGAPDVLLERCASERTATGVRPLTDARRRHWSAEVEALADRALRTLAVAYRPIDDLVGEVIDEVVEDVESDLVLLGIVGLTDPPRVEVADAIHSAHRGGVRVIMITGDHPRTAARIAEQLDLTDDGGLAVTGRDLSAADDDELDELARRSNVFARVDPEHKLRLVRALQGSGQITAMTGDGVNDAPALRQADIGVAMGMSGTEVSKEAADMILADDNFATILRAVREGREIFADIRKFLRYLLASNAGEVLVVFLGVVFAAQFGLSAEAGELAVPLLATQILWINLVTDGALALALGVDPPVENVMDHQPRALSERVVDRAMARTIVFVGLATAVVSLIAFDITAAGGMFGGSGDIATARTMTFTTLVLAQVGNAFTARSDTVSAFVGALENRVLWAAAAVTVLAQVAVVHVPWLSTAFDTVSLTIREWSLCAALAGLVLVAAELLKVAIRARERARRG